MLPGSWDSAVVDGLRATESDLYVDKARMDAFYNTDLELLLRGLSAERLAVSGIVTNACVETTTRSAAMRDLDVMLLRGHTSLIALHPSSGRESPAFLKVCSSWSESSSRVALPSL